MRESVQKAVLFVGILIMLGVLAPLAGLAAGVLVLVLFDLTGPWATVAVAVAMVATTALGCWAGLVLESHRDPET